MTSFKACGGALDAVGSAAVIADLAAGLGLESFGEFFDVLSCLLLFAVSLPLGGCAELLLAVVVD